jgi:hypothetical protein
LTLDYNKARQAKITMELCEIISGAAAVWLHRIYNPFIYWYAVWVGRVSWIDGIEYLSIFGKEI